MRSTDASSTHNPGNVVLDPDQMDFSRDTNGLQMTVSSRFNCNTNLDRIDEIRGKITFEADDWAVSKSNFDQETRIHHSCSSKSFLTTFCILSNRAILLVSTYRFIILSPIISGIIRSAAFA